MRHTLFIFVFSLLSSFGLSHEYYFAFAEVEYNELSETFEATLSASSHDLELIFSERGISVDKLEEYTSDSKEWKQVLLFISSHFSITSDQSDVSFHLLGIDVLLNGSIQFYIESDKVELAESLSFDFDLLMDEYPLQQNKLTFFFRGNTHNLIFLRGKHQQQVQLEHK